LAAENKLLLKPSVPAQAPRGAAGSTAGDVPGLAAFSSDYSREAGVGATSFSKEVHRKPVASRLLLAACPFFWPSGFLLFERLLRVTSEIKVAWGCPALSCPSAEQLCTRSTHTSASSCETQTFKRD